MIVLLILIPIIAAGLAFAVGSNRYRPWLLPATSACHLAVAAWLLPMGDQWAVERWPRLIR